MMESRGSICDRFSGFYFVRKGMCVFDRRMRRTFVGFRGNFSRSDVSSMSAASEEYSRKFAVGRESWLCRGGNWTANVRAFIAFFSVENVQERAL